MKRSFSPQLYFDLIDFPFSDIFNKTGFPWEALAKIEKYIDTFFETKEVKQNYKREMNIHIGKGTEISEGSVIKGSALIGKNCYIENGSFLRENCIIGDDVHIGHGVEIKNSIILNGAAIAHLNYVGDSIIGKNVNFSAGAVTANLRFDKRSILVNIKGREINTGLMKFGAIVGDNSVIGVNSVLNPGTILGKNSIVYPLSSVKGTHREGEVIRT